MNRYPLWKYLLLIAVTVIALIFALPNLYPSEPAVQVTAAEKTTLLGPGTVDTVKSKLADAKLIPKTVDLDLKAQNAVFHFDTPDTQLAAQETIRKALGTDYKTALNLAPTTPEWLSSMSAKPMNLGLDLRGGVHFLMEVDMSVAIDKALDRHKDEFRTILREKKLRYLGIKKYKKIPNSLIVLFKNEEARNEAQTVLKREYRTDVDFAKIDTDKGFGLGATLTPLNIKNAKRFILQQNIITLRRKLNSTGLSEPIIQQQGLERIIVQLPGVQDPSAVKDKLSGTATLEFHMVDEGNDAQQALASGQIPAGSKLFKERDGRPVLLKRKIILSGDRITQASAGFDESQMPSVNISLDAQGAKRFSKITGANIKKLMAVVYIEDKYITKKLDDGTIHKKRVTKKEVISIAQIQSQLGKRFMINGLDSPQEAHLLAEDLRAGALAAPVYIVEERTVGPSLGADNIKAGFNSVIIGFILVLIFMAIYYKVFGLVANMALTLNLVLIVAALSLMQATLTLPGIAGIVLTVGMAVDANVLIFERIKEELKNGLTPQAAIHSGYEKAFSTIADANITTLIAAIVLFGMGTGPIQGFATTLAIGIVSSMFTAIFGTRAIINLIYGGKKITKLSI
jgi:preprotein translocase subunit SecD